MNSAPNYQRYLADVNDWATRMPKEGHIKQLIFPSTSLREAVQIANFLRKCGYKAKVNKVSNTFQEIIVEKSV